VDKFCTANASSGEKLVDEGKLDAACPWAEWQVFAGYTILLSLFTCSETAWPEPEASLMMSKIPRNLVMIPAFAILIIGLALEADPLARLLKKPPFSWGDLISYELYIMQRAGIPLTLLWSTRWGLDKVWEPVIYICVLHALAILAYYVGKWATFFGRPFGPAEVKKV
jgi:peptidoglycan/LPS O-acetylase OafA/YrhL